jgi:hypothetical protein
VSLPRHVTDGRIVEVMRFRTTEAGRKALSR